MPFNFVIAIEMFFVIFLFRLILSDKVHSFSGPSEFRELQSLSLSRPWGQSMSSYFVTGGGRDSVLVLVGSVFVSVPAYLITAVKQLLKSIAVNFHRMNLFKGNCDNVKSLPTGQDVVHDSLQVLDRVDSEDDVISGKDVRQRAGSADDVRRSRDYHTSDANADIGKNRTFVAALTLAFLSVRRWHY